MTSIKLVVKNGPKCCPTDAYLFGSLIWAAVCNNYWPPIIH